MQIGYARVFTQAQTLDRQIGALNSAGVDRVFREKASAKTVKNRPRLEKAIDALGAGDVLVIAEWDRATRSMMDGITIIQRVAERGAAVSQQPARIIAALPKRRRFKGLTWRAKYSFRTKTPTLCWPRRLRGASASTALKPISIPSTMR